MNIMKSGWLLLTVSAAIFAKKSDASTMANSILQIRGGTVPQADEAGSDYYEQFELDYGSADKRRVAGATRGFIKSGKLEGLSESDPFKKWLNQHLEKGSEPITGRLKPFYVRSMISNNSWSLMIFPDTFLYINQESNAFYIFDSSDIRSNNTTIKFVFNNCIQKIFLII